MKIIIVDQEGCTDDGDNYYGSQITTRVFDEPSEAIEYLQKNDTKPPEISITLDELTKTTSFQATLGYGFYGQNIHQIVFGGQDFSPSFYDRELENRKSKLPTNNFVTINLSLQFFAEKYPDFGEKYKAGIEKAQSRINAINKKKALTTLERERKKVVAAQKLLESKGMLVKEPPT